MAGVITGNDGVVALPTSYGGAAASGALYGWRARFVNTFTEVTGFTGQTNLRRNRGGLISVEGSAFGQPYDEGDPGVGNAVSSVQGTIVANPDGGSLLLTAQTGNTWQFTASCSAVSYEMNKRDNTALITFDFVGGNANDFVEAWT